MAAADPGENRNLVEQHPEVAAALEELAGTLAAGGTAAQEPEPVLDPEVAEKLKAMGYLY